LFETRTFQATVWLLLVLAVLWLGQQVSFVFRPVVVLITTIFLPFVLAGLLYYLTDPAVSALQRLGLPRTAAIAIVYVLLGGLLLAAVLWLGPLLERQLSTFVVNIPAILRQLDEYIHEFQHSALFSRFTQFEFFRRWSEIDYTVLVDTVLDTVAVNLLNVVGSIANIAIALFTVPFLLFYLLRDGHKLPPLVAQAFPEEYRGRVVDLFHTVSETISSYVQGLIVVCLFVGVSVYIGLRLIGLDYALLLAAVAMVTDVIPYLGPVLGTLPALIVGLLVSPWTALQVLVVVIIVQQLESHLVSPLVLGKKLNIHPVTIIVILLTAGSMAGILGLVLGVPIFAVAKVLVTEVVKLVRDMRRGKVLNNSLKE
jgi:predicted PurR-regulated permease PerM